MTPANEGGPPDGADRRAFLSRAGMFLGLGGSYGLLGAFALRYLYPLRPDPRGWMFVTELARLATGSSMSYVTPAGDAVLITRQGPGDTAGDFVALSSTCPHLGCRVRWEEASRRFVCPCHDGTFDARGVATGGPPRAGGTDLARYSLRVEDGLLFIDVPLRPAPAGPARLG